MSLVMDTFAPAPEGRGRRPEPFATILDLIDEHGMGEVLQCVSHVALFESEDEAEEYCDECRARRFNLHRELEEVIEHCSAPVIEDIEYGNN